MRAYPRSFSHTVGLPSPSPLPQSLFLLLLLRVTARKWRENRVTRRGGRDNNINAFTSFAAEENKLKDLLECKEVEQYHFPTLVISGKDKEQDFTVAVGGLCFDKGAEC